MKTTLVKGLVAVLALVSVSAQAYASVSQDLESLGTNAESVRRANRLESRSRIAIVQNRSVDRHWRLELGTNVGAVASGDSYVNTQNLGANLDLHINPKFSLGVHYAKAFNQLSNEGKNQWDSYRSAVASGNLNVRAPETSYVDYSVMGIANWYMMYGKINFFDMSVVQFDIYSLAGAGQIVTGTGSSPTWTAGGGIGFWLSQHFTSRIELRYQNYTDHLVSGDRNMNTILANIGLGVLL